MPDLVERLRYEAQWNCTRLSYKSAESHADLMLEAAKEIEFVRAAYTRLLRQWDAKAAERRQHG